jgi:hypothetical protein
VRARGASTGYQCTRNHGFTVFYIELIDFISRGFNPHFDFLLKIGCQWAGGTVHRMAHGEGGRGRGAARSGLARGSAARSVGEEEEQGRGTGPGWVFLFLVSNIK